MKDRRRFWKRGWGGFIFLLWARSAVPTEATTSVTMGVYVLPWVKWVGSNARSVVLEGEESSETFRLALNVDVLLTAQVTPFTRVADPADVLETEWKIEDDGDVRHSGVGERNAAIGWGNFVSGWDFLRGGVRIIHRPGDGNVCFRVTARTGSVRGEGSYRASVVLTAIAFAARRTP